VNTRRILVLLTALFLGCASIACGGGSSVGEDIDVDTLDGTAAPRLGERTAAPTAKATSAPASGRPAATAAAKTPAPAAAPSLVIKIQSDNAAGGSQFDPRIARVRRGSIVRWTNTDDKPRSVEADNGAFRSPSIPPGGKFDYTADTAGSFNYHDGTRPYAVGSLEVS
jgi:plastocyanin